MGIRRTAIVRVDLCASIVAIALGVVACEHDTASPREPQEPREARAAAMTAAPSTAASTTPVLVELFTSQGCSSCPPADSLLRQVVEGGEGPPVVALAYHVDYWNNLGWPDPFSQPRWTKRQYDYAEAFGSSRVYTPQLLFDGRDRSVGTSRSRTDAALRHAAAEPEVLQLTLDTERSGRSVRVDVSPEWLDGAAPIASRVMVALTDSGHRTKVPRGENAGRVLAGNYVVRDLARACTLGADEDGSRCRATLSARKVDDLETMQIVAFAQTSESWRVLAVAMADPS
ncbi:MAG: DUF1223 domain-containing protein [Myxococcota bacterium]